MDQNQPSWQQVWNNVEICMKFQRKTSQFCEKKVSFYEARSKRLQVLENVLKDSLGYYETILASIKPVSMKVDPMMEQDWKPVTNQLETYVGFLLNSRQLCTQQIEEYEKRAENLRCLSDVQIETLKYYEIVLESLYAVQGAAIVIKDRHVNSENNMENFEDPIYGRTSSKGRDIVEKARDNTKKRIFIKKTPPVWKTDEDVEKGIEIEEDFSCFSHKRELNNTDKSVFLHKGALYFSINGNHQDQDDETEKNKNHEQTNKEEVNKYIDEETRADGEVQNQKHDCLNTSQPSSLSPNSIIYNDSKYYCKNSANNTIVSLPSKLAPRNHSASSSSNKRSGASTSKDNLMFPLDDQDHKTISRGALITSTKASHKSNVNPIKNSQAGQVAKKHITGSSSRNKSQEKADHGDNIHKPQRTADALTELKTDYAITRTNKSEQLADVELTSVVLDLHETTTNFEEQDYKQQHNNITINHTAGNSRELLVINDTSDSLISASQCNTGDQQQTATTVDVDSEQMFNTIHSRCNYMPTISENTECDNNNAGSAGRSVVRGSNNKNNKQTSNISVGTTKSKNMTSWSIVNDSESHNHSSNNNNNNNNSINNVDQNANFTAWRKNHCADGSEEDNSVFSNEPSSSSDLDLIPSILDCVGRRDEDLNLAKLRDESQQNINKPFNGVVITPTSSPSLSFTNGLCININKHTSTEVISNRGNSSDGTSALVSTSSASKESRSLNKTVNIQYRRKKWNGFTIKST